MILEGSWKRFVKIFERVGRALEQESETDNDEDDDVQQKQRLPDNNRKPSACRKDNDCFD